jgi:broad specificity phosphatase PhoE
MLSVQHIIPEGRLNSCSSSPGVAAWGWEEVAAWLTEIGMQQYQDSFQKHAIESGRELLQLKEGHLKEMGVGKVGHRLRLCEHLRELRRLAKVTADGVDMDSLLPQLDEARAARFMHRQPKRIILIRHAESVGNVDSSVYAHIPDNKLVITERGRQQAYAAGQQLKEMVAHESVTFYVSPFLRSKQTYDQLRMCFHDEQVLCYREDPRLREQEWGNLQDAEQMEKIKQQRKETGAFYYRFPTGESGADVFDRVSMFLETLYRDMEKGTCGQNTIIVTHGLFCRLFLTRYYHWSVGNLSLALLSIKVFHRWRSFTSYGTLTIASLPSWNCSQKDTTN